MINSGAGSKTVAIDANFIASCAGDCDANGTVGVNELIRGINIALGNAPATNCAAFDGDSSGTVGINELVAAVNSALRGCS